MPLLLLLLFGIISYGFMLSFRQALSQGSAEGARAAAVAVEDATRTTAALAALNDSLDFYGVTCAGGSLLKGGETVGSCSVAIAPCTNDASADCATLSVVYGYADHSLLPSLPFVPLPDELRYSAVARVS